MSPSMPEVSPFHAEISHGIRRATRQAVKTVGENADRLWADMGLYTLTFFAFPRGDQVLVAV